MAFRGLTAGVVALMFGSALAADGNLAAKVSALVAKLSATPEDAKLTTQPVKHAQEALKRAQQTRKAGDGLSTSLLEETALEWAHLGGDLLVAHKQEAAAREAERALMETTNQLRRAEAFLEETEARRGRALAQLEHPEETAAPPASAAPSTRPVIPTQQREAE